MCQENVITKPVRRKILLTDSTNISCRRNLTAVDVRAVWLATNYNLDWPNCHTTTGQQTELTNILDSLQKHNFNTVLFQVRTRGRVLYHSKIEPKALVATSFDPLSFVVRECHKRGMECHAWMVVYPLGKKPSTIPSFAKRFRNEWYLDPGNPKTDDYLLSLVEEIVNGYDIDGILFDYIRYPARGKKFPDDSTYRLYGKGQTREEWRRNNITRFVSKAYDRVKMLKPWVQVSASPLGRYRDLNGKGRGWTAYESVNQDAGHWIAMGKMDALYPMMYFDDCYFDIFLEDWKKQAGERLIVPGIGIYMMDEVDRSLSETLRQIDAIRREQMPGIAYFRARHLLNNIKGITDALDSEYYIYPAKLPPMHWLSDSIPAEPIDISARKGEDGLFHLSWNVGEDRQSAAKDMLNAGGYALTYTVYRSETSDFSTDKADNIIATGLNHPYITLKVKDDEKAYYYYITASNRYHNESKPSAPAFFFHSKLEK